MEQLVVRYTSPGAGEMRALDGVDLTVGTGETVAVLGPSGSGKTTLLRAIAGLEQPTSGRVLRDGSDLAGVPPHRRDLGLMFQDHALFPHRDVLANVMFGLRMHGVSTREAAGRARETLTLVGLSGFEHRSVHDLSGGEQQRVALARALAPAPSLLMLDEPLGSLDRRLRESLVDELRSLFDALDLSVLFVTHDHDEALALGDRVAVMAAGRVEQVDTPEALWNRPATAFTARFLGWNVLHDTARRGTVAIRPDGLRITADGELAGVVEQRTFRRDHFLVRVALDGTSERLDVVVRDRVAPAIGEAVCLRVDAERRVELPRPAPNRPAPNLHTFDR